MTYQKPLYKTNTVIISVGVPKELYDAIEEKAFERAQNTKKWVSISKVVREILQEYTGVRA